MQILKCALYTIILSNLFNLFSGRKCRPIYTYPYARIDYLNPHVAVRIDDWFGLSLGCGAAASAAAAAAALTVTCREPPGKTSIGKMLTVTCRGPPGQAEAPARCSR